MVAGVITAIAAIIGVIVSAAIGGANYDQQKKNLDYQKSLNSGLLDQSNNAVQRRVADLKAAGLSPTLAAGSSATVPQPITTQAPQFDARGLEQGISGMPKNIMEVMKTNQDITSSKAQASLNRQKQDESYLSMKTIDAQRKLYESGAYKNYIEAGISKYDLEKSKEGGWKTKPGYLGDAIQSLSNPITQYMRPFAEKADSFGQGLWNKGYDFYKKFKLQDYTQGGDYKR